MNRANALFLQKQCVVASAKSVRYCTCLSALVGRFELLRVLLVEQKKTERSGVVKTGAEKGGRVANNGVLCRCHTFQHLSIGIEQIVEVLRGGGLEVRSQARANQILGMSTASIQSSLLLLIMSLNAILMVPLVQQQFLVCFIF